MKICFVGPANSAHIEKWCTWFSGRGHEIHVVSFTSGKILNANVHQLDIGVNTEGSDFGKLKYLFTGKKLKKIIQEIKPDVINVHYATSYGVAMALSGIKKYVLSVWGSDIYDFPKKSFFHRLLLKFSLKKADYLFSTSQAMADEAKQYTDKKFMITPFGVDMDLFNPNKRTRANAEPPFVFGIVKTLSELYGIRYILEAASIIRKQNPDLEIAVRISGDGSKREEYRELVKKLEIEDCTLFLGKISQQQAATEWANMDVAVIPSVLYESFGVAAVEAEASGTPVIVSEVAGLLETTNPGYSSVVVGRMDAQAISDALLRLYRDSDLRRKMGAEGRKYAIENYELNRCFNDIEKNFSEFVGGGVKKLVLSSADEFMMAIEIKKREDFVIGTVKGLSDKYGISFLLRAVAEVKTLGKIPIKLRIAGKGPQEEEYRQLAHELGIEDLISWLGFISQEEAAKEWANFDLAIIPSTLESESFGVSAVEAQACKTAVIISDIPGLMEATKPGISSVVVPRNEAHSIAEAIQELYQQPELRKKYADSGLKYVRNNYEIQHCFLKIEEKLKEYRYS